jgi:hypothetical protein
VEEGVISGQIASTHGQITSAGSYSTPVRRNSARKQARKSGHGFRAAHPWRIRGGLGWGEKGWSRDGGWIGRHGMGVGVPGASPLAFLVKSQANRSRFDLNICGSTVVSGRSLALKTIADAHCTRQVVVAKNVAAI